MAKEDAVISDRVEFVERKFRTQYDEFAVQSNPGSRTREVYAAQYGDHGILEFEVVGKEDIQDFINSFEESVDIYSILNRYANGEIDVLDRVQGFFQDVTQMPKTYMDVLNMNLKTQQFFDELPIEIKKEFDGSYENFMLSLGEKDFLERVNNATANAGFEDNPLKLYGSDNSGDSKSIEVKDGE